MELREKIITCGYRNFKNDILLETMFLDEHYIKISFAQRIWHIKNNNFILQRCEVCGSLVPYDYKRTMYRKTCSKECFAIHSKTIRVQKQIITCTKTYNVSNPNKLRSSKEKAKETCIKKFGVDHYSKTVDFSLKIKKTCNEKYGKEYYSQTSEWLKKVKETNSLKYGVEYYLQTNDFKNKSLNSHNLNYNGIGYQSRLLREKSELSCLKKYGEKNIAKTEQYRNDMSKNCKEWRLQNSEQYKEYWLKKFNTEIVPGYIVLKNLENSNYLVYCNKCHKNFIINRRSTYQKRIERNQEICTLCNPLKKNYSNGEKEISNFIKLFHKGKIQENIRTIIRPYEIDIFLPELNLAIEYNGDYWHANPKFYKSTDFIRTAFGKQLFGQDVWQKDALKKKLCKEKSIKLITIWETDWLNRQETIKRYLKIKLQ